MCTHAALMWTALTAAVSDWCPLTLVHKLCNHLWFLAVAAIQWCQLARHSIWRGPHKVCLESVQGPLHKWGEGMVLWFLVSRAIMSLGIFYRFLKTCQLTGCITFVKASLKTPLIKVVWRSLCSGGLELDKFLAELDGMFLSIKVPHDFTRKPRSFRELQHWKASEFRLSVLFAGLPLLQQSVLSDFFSTRTLLSLPLL